MCLQWSQKFNKIKKNCLIAPKYVPYSSSMHPLKLHKVSCTVEDCRMFRDLPCDPSLCQALLSNLKQCNCSCRHTIHVRICGGEEGSRGLDYILHHESLNDVAVWYLFLVDVTDSCRRSPAALPLGIRLWCFVLFFWLDSEMEHLAATEVRSSSEAVREQAPPERGNRYLIVCKVG